MHVLVAASQEYVNIYSTRRLLILVQRFTPKPKQRAHKTANNCRALLKGDSGGLSCEYE